MARDPEPGAGAPRERVRTIDSWLAAYNAGYAASVTPEDGLDVTAPIRTNVASQSLVLTRTMDYWGRTGGLSIVIPYLYVESSSGSNGAAVSGVKDINLRSSSVSSSRRRSRFGRAARALSRGENLGNFLTCRIMDANLQ